MRDSFCGWWRNRLTTQKNDRRWRTKEHPDHLTVDRSYTICNNRPGHCPSLPWVLWLACWSETKKILQKFIMFSNDSLIYTEFYWVSQDGTRSGEAQPLTEGRRLPHTTHYCWLSHSTTYRVFFIGPESDHWQPLSLTHSLTNSLTHWLLFTGLDGCEWYQLLDDVATATESCEKLS